MNQGRNNEYELCLSTESNEVPKDCERKGNIISQERKEDKNITRAYFLKKNIVAGNGN